MFVRDFSSRGMRTLIGAWRQSNCSYLTCCPAYECYWGTPGNSGGSSRCRTGRASNPCRWSLSSMGFACLTDELRPSPYLFQAGWHPSGSIASLRKCRYSVDPNVQLARFAPKNLEPQTPNSKPEWTVPEDTTPSYSRYHWSHKCRCSTCSWKHNLKDQATS